MNYADQALGTLARTIPGATRIFHEHQLDFCCGGKQTLQAAAQTRGLDAGLITQELERLDRTRTPEDTDLQRWAQADTAALIEHLLVRYHHVHRQQLPELIRLARRVESVHGDRPECPAGLADHLQTMLQELESHMQKEELILFPLLRSGAAGMAGGPIGVMREEHDHHGQSLQRLSDLTNGITLPKGACNTWRALYMGLQTLRTDLMQHIHLENNVLFERH